jgi:hypothetical protein
MKLKLMSRTVKEGEKALAASTCQVVKKMEEASTVLAVEVERHQQQ